MDLDALSPIPKSERSLSSFSDDGLQLEESQLPAYTARLRASIDRADALFVSTPPSGGSSGDEVNDSPVGSSRRRSRLTRRWSSQILAASSRSRNHPAVAVVVGCGVAFLYSLSAVMGKTLMRRGVPPLITTSARGALGGVCVLVHLALAGGAEVPRSCKLWGLLTLRATAGCAAMFTFYVGLSKLPMGNATALFMTSPIFCAILGALVFREGVRLLQLVSLMLSTAGVLMIVQPEVLFGRQDREERHQHTAVYSAVMLCSAILAAVGWSAVQAMSGKVSPKVQVLVFMTVNGVLTGLVGLSLGAWDDVDWADGRAVACLLGVGVFGFGAQSLLTIAISMSSAAVFSLTQQLEVVLAFGWDMLLFSDRPTPWILAGALLVTLSVVLLAARSEKDKLDERLTPPSHSRCWGCCSGSSSGRRLTSKTKTNLVVAWSPVARSDGFEDSKRGVLPFEIHMEEEEGPIGPSDLCGRAAEGLEF